MGCLLIFLSFIFLINPMNGVEFNSRRTFMPAPFIVFLLVLLLIAVYYFRTQKRYDYADRQRSYNTTLEVVCTICTEMFDQKKFNNTNECEVWLREKGSEFERRGLKGINEVEAREIARKARSRSCR